MIWTHGRSTLDTFTNGLHHIKPRLKFTVDISEQQATFLDVKVFKGNRFNATHILDTAISYKNTNHFMFVHGQSYHPRSTYKSIARGEALRILWNCSAEVDSGCGFACRRGSFIHKRGL